VHRLVDFDELRNILLHESESRVPLQGRHVRACARQQVVDAEYVPSLLNQQIAKMRPQKPRATRHHCPQFPSSALVITTAATHSHYSNSFPPPSLPQTPSCGPPRSSSPRRTAGNSV